MVKGSAFKISRGKPHLALAAACANSVLLVIQRDEHVASLLGSQVFVAFRLRWLRECRQTGHTVTPRLPIRS